MENIQWKAVIIFLALIIFAVCFRDVVQFLTMVVTEFVNTVTDIIRSGLRGHNGIESMVRFCITVIMIFGLIKLLKPRQ